MFCHINVMSHHGSLAFYMMGKYTLTDLVLWLLFLLKFPNSNRFLWRICVCVVFRVNYGCFWCLVNVTDRFMSLMIGLPSNLWILGVWFIYDLCWTPFLDYLANEARSNWNELLTKSWKPIYLLGLNYYFPHVCKVTF